MSQPITAWAEASLGAPPPQLGRKEELPLAYLLVMSFVFMATSRILDFTIPSLHLPLILAVAAAGLTFVTHGITKAFSTSVGKLIGLYTLWFIICIPFSQWKGGSVGVFVDDLSRSFLVFVMVASVISRIQQVQGMMAIIGSGTVITMAIALVANHRVDGRLTMSAGQYSNPNDLAQIMLVGMCFLPILGTWRKLPVLRWLSYAMMVPFLYTILITGSRGALLTAILISGLVFIFASPMRKILLITVLPLLVVGLLTISPTARMRLGTLLDGRDDSGATSASEEIAIASTSGRLETLKQSLQLTLHHPLFGVGPGGFQAASASLQNSEGQRAMWLETHNSYTQVSSETGVPGAIFFCGGVWGSVAGLLRVRRRAAKNEKLKVLCSTVDALLLGFLTFAVTSLFSSVAYGFIFWMLLGLCAATILVAERELKAAASPSPGKPFLFGPVPAQAIFQPPVTLSPPTPATRVTLSGKIKPVRNPTAGSRK